MRESQVFCQQDHQIDISLYLKEATTLRLPWKLANLAKSSCTFRSMSLLTSKILKSIPFHFIRRLVIFSTAFSLTQTKQGVLSLLEKHTRPSGLEKKKARKLSWVHPVES
jgi:hypothetical protein